MTPEHQAYVLSACAAYLRHFRPSGALEELELAQRFFAYVASGRYVIGMTFDNILLYNEHQSALLRVIAGFLERNEQIAAAGATALLNLFVRQVPADFVRELERRLRKSLELPQRESLYILIIKQLFIQFKVYKKKVRTITEADAGDWFPFESAADAEEFAAEELQGIPGAFSTP